MTANHSYTIFIRLSSKHDNNSNRLHALTTFNQSYFNQSYDRREIFTVPNTFHGLEYYHWNFKEFSPEYNAVENITINLLTYENDMFKLVDLNSEDYDYYYVPIMNYSRRDIDVSVKPLILHLKYLNQMSCRYNGMPKFSNSILQDENIDKRDIVSIKMLRTKKGSISLKKREHIVKWRVSRNKNLRC